jgi:putative thioredoxin
MTLLPYVFDASHENFDSLVLGNSARGLVLVHFWSPKAGPCMVLMPRLVRLAAEYGGRFLLVMANTDELGRRARDLGVSSVPTVKFFLRGEVVHTIHGAEPDSTFHEALSRFLAGDQDRLRMAALRAHQEGRTAEAIAMLAQAAVEAPGDLAVALDLAKLLTLDGRPDEALSLLTALPIEARRRADIAPLLIHLELIAAAASVATPEAAPDTPEALLSEAARALLDNRMEAALEQLLELARTAPGFRDDIGRRALISLFDLLGGEHELTRSYRSRLAGLAT